MSSLTEAALFSKKAFFWLILAVAVVIGLVIFLGIGKTIKTALFPPKPLPATVAFDKIGGIDLSEGFKAPGSVNYSLETISGGFPVLSESAKVFAIDNPMPTFGDLERIKIKADAVGFRGQPVEIFPGVFEFSDPRDESRKLAIDSVSGNFTLQTDYLNDTEIISSRPQSEKSAIDVAIRFLEKYELKLDDYPEDKIKVRKLRIDGGKLTETPSLSTANVIEVNFYRDSLDEIPVYWVKDEGAEISVIVAQREVVYAKTNVIPVLKHKFASYPLKNPSVAFEELKKGLGYFNKPIITSQLAIINISLGYVMSENTKDFLVPVFVFEGADGLKGYIVAVSDQWFDGAPVRSE